MSSRATDLGLREIFFFFFYTTDRRRPLNKYVKPLLGVGYVHLTLTYPTPSSGLTYT